MKKFIAIVITLTAVLGFCTLAASAQTANVNVIIANGDIVFSDSVAVEDTDNDGILTIKDALYSAHEKGFDGGAAAGFGSAETEWGTSLTKLWGIENGGSYGYKLNNTDAMSLADEVKDGDTVYAFVYTDTVNFSDIFTFFDSYTVSSVEGEDVPLTLSVASYDEAWMPIASPFSGAHIIINGENTDAVTDENGNVVLSFEKAGIYTVSASGETSTVTYVPPLSLITVMQATNPSTADSDFTFVILAAASLIGIVAIVKTKKTYEK